MSTFDIAKIYWSNPRIVQTKRGRRRVRTWTIPPNSPFWRLWETSNLRQQDYTVAKWQGDWVLTEWRLPDGNERSAAQAEAAAATESQRMEHTLDQAEVELPPAMRKRWKKVERIYQQIMEDTGDDYSYQFPSIKRLALAAEAFDGGLDASDTGVGKTPVACAVALLLDRDLFVVCPKSVIPPWERMAALFGVRITAINYEMLRTGNTEYGYWAADRSGKQRNKPFRKFVFDGLDPQSRLFVFDECHKMKDWRTQNCAMGVAAIDAQYKTLALSATAADNPMHMKFIALLTGLIRHPNHFYGWMMNNGVKEGRFGLEFVGGRQVLSRIHRQIFPLHGSRIRVADIADRFPETRIISEAYTVDDPRQINAIYEEMRREIADLEAKKSANWKANVLEAQLRARQQVELLKVPTFKRMAEDAMEEGMNAVIALNYTDSIVALARRMRTTNLLIGDTPMDERQSLIDRFNADDENLIVMNLKLGVGIGLHGTSRGRMRAVYISPTFSAPDLIQMFGRVPRGGGAASIQYLVWAAGTVEERACDKVRERMHRISIFNDDQLEHSLQI